MNHVLKLYVAADTPHSARAVASVKDLCETHLKDHHELEVIDILEHPELAQRDVILAVPTVTKTSPPPVRRVVGDLSDPEKVLAGLGIAPMESACRDAGS